MFMDPTRTQGRLEAGLGRDQGALHEIDFEDVAISAKAVTLIRKAVRQILSRHMPGSRPEALTQSQAIAMFLDRLFWDAENGGLLMCMEVAEMTFCLPIPKSDWSMRPPHSVQ